MIFVLIVAILAASAVLLNAIDAWENVHTRRENDKRSGE